MTARKLEDEFGDIVGKARRGLGLSARQLAEAAQLDPAQISAIEAYQLTPDRDAIRRIAAALKLHGEKLAAIALDGWLPARKTLSEWGNIAVISSDYGGGIVNCYLHGDDAQNAALFDTGVDADAVLRAIADKKLNLRCIFITHSHGDHVAALGEIRARHPQAQVRHESATVGQLSVTAADTPGHSSDGITYVVRGKGNRPPVAYVGDSLFAGSVGGAGYSYEVLLKNVREHILSLPDDTLLCPGHGPLTTVAEEKHHNPFFL
jgi:glyoxylase-like metal-dependent hydrolase (beta-lactamase superfamily II)